MTKNNSYEYKNIPEKMKKISWVFLICPSHEEQV